MKFLLALLTALALVPPAFAQTQDEEITPVTANKQVDKTGQPQSLRGSEISGSVGDEVEFKQINVPIAEDVNLQVPATDHRVQVYNPSNTPGTLRGNEPSMAPVVQAEVEFGEENEVTVLEESGDER